MSSTAQKIAESRTFNDLKNEILGELADLENSVYSQNSGLDSLQRKIDKLYSIALDLEHEYFILRLQTVQTQFRKLKSKKGYRQLEFDRLFKLLEKLKDTDTVEFINDSIKNRIEKLSKKVVEKKITRKIHPAEFRENKFIIYTFQKLYFIVKSLPKRILHKVPYSQKRVRFMEEAFDIFPFIPFDEQISAEKHSKLLILRHGLDFKPLRFDSIESEIEIFPDELINKRKPMSGKTESIKNFLKWKGNNCYLIEFPEVF